MTFPVRVPEILEMEDVELPELQLDQLPDDPIDTDGIDVLEQPTDEDTGADADL